MARFAPFFRLLVMAFAPVSVQQFLGSIWSAVPAEYVVPGETPREMLERDLKNSRGVIKTADHSKSKKVNGIFRDFRLKFFDRGAGAAKRGGVWRAVIST